MFLTSAFGIAWLAITPALAAHTPGAQTSGAQTAASDTLREAWVGKLDIPVMQPVMQFRIVEAGAGATTAFFDSITEKRTDFEAQWSIEAGTLKFDVPVIKATYRGALNEAGDTAVGRFEQGGRSFALTLRRQASAYENVDVWENRPQRPQAPFPYTSEDVTFQGGADGVTLAGTLTVPKEPGRHPAVILISGSGPQDRDETLLEHKPFLVLADDLGRRGIAVLRYDDRGTAHSTGNFAPATTEDFVLDATAALDFLEQHERISADRIGLVGHSEGGLVAPMVAAVRKDVALIVLLAAPGVPGEKISYSQTEAMTRAEGGDDAALRANEAVLDAVIAVVKDPKAGPDRTAEIERAVAETVLALPEAEQKRAAERRDLFRALLPTYASPWFRFILLHDPRPTLREVRCPVLALNGEKDLQVLPKLNLSAIEATLTAAGHRDFETVELPGLNHLFQQCQTGSMSEYISIPETINPAALQKIGEWITRRSSPVPRAR